MNTKQEGSCIVSRFILLVAGVLFLFVGGCGTQDGAIINGTPTGGTTSDVTTTGIVDQLEVTLGSAKLVADGTSSAIVKVRVIDTVGAPVAGKSVIFKTNLGSFSGDKSAAGVTNVDGYASANLTSEPILGKATVTVISDGVTSPDNFVDFVSGAPTKVNFYVSPGEGEQITSGYNNEYALEFYLTDANNLPVSGEQLDFSLSPSVLGQLDQATVTSDANGRGTLKLTTGNAAASGALDCFLHSNRSITDRIDLTVAANVTIGNLSLTTGNTSAVVGSTTPVSVRATVVDTSGAPVPGVSVSFTANLGSLATASATTGANGIAEVSWTPGATVGTDILTASLNGFSDTANINIISGSGNTLSLSPTTATVAPGASVELRASVVDASSNPVSGETVVLNISGAGGGNLSSINLTTDANGQAVTTYTAGTTSGVDTVTARLNSNAAITASSALTVSAANVTIGNLSLTTGNTSAVVGSTTPVSVRATVVDTSGAPVPGVSVSFTANLGSLATASATTGANGIAEVSWTPGATVGTDILTASLNGFNRVANIEIVPDTTTAMLTLQSTATTLYAGDSAQLTAQLTDAAQNPIAGELITFDLPGDTSVGTFSKSTATTDITGRAQVTYTAGSNLPADLSLTAQVIWQGNQAVKNTVPLTLKSNPLQNLALIAARSSMIADGSSSVEIEASLSDRSGNSVNGQSCAFSTTAGSVSPVTGTTINGRTSTTLTSGTQLGVANVTVACAELTANTSISLISGPATSVNIQLSPITLAPGQATTLSVAVTDAQGHPASNETVNLTVSTNNTGGTLSELAVLTDSNGRANALYNAGQVPGNDTLTATLANSSSTSANVSVSAQTIYPQNLTLTALDSSILADGSSSALLRVTLTDVNADPIANALVAFSASLGTLDNATVMTDDQGFADVLLTSITQVVKSTVNASYAGLNATASVDFIAGSATAGNSSITASPQTLPADATSTTEVTVVLHDAANLPVADNTPVTLYTTDGTLVANSATTLNGRAIFTLTAPSAPKTATLTIGGVPGLSGTVFFGSTSTGDPANISLAANHSEIFVAGVGQQDTTQLGITVSDLAGNPIDETTYTAAINNLRVSFVSHPAGGETLSGYNVAGTYVSGNSVDLVTRNGKATVLVASGSVAGILEIKVEALLDANGTSLTSPITAIFPQISIASGPAHSMSLAVPDTCIVETIPGFYDCAMSLGVVDRYGNPVPDGTLVNVGLVDASDRTSGADISRLFRQGNVTSTNLTNLEDSGATFTSDTQDVNGSPRLIQRNDFVLIPTAPAVDKVRFVDSVVDNNNLTVRKSYLGDHAGKGYLVGAALTGSQVFGNTDGNLTQGTIVVNQGSGSIVVRYPSGAPDGVALDTYYLVIRSSDDTASYVKELTYFVQLPVEIVPDTTSIGASNTINFTVSDAGGYELEGATLTSNVAYTTKTDPAFDVSTGPIGKTDTNGRSSVAITVVGGNSGDSASVDLLGLQAKATITVKIP